MYVQFQFQFSWWGCWKKTAKHKHLIFLSRVPYWAPLETLLLSKIGMDTSLYIKKWRSALQKLIACSSHWPGVSFSKMQGLWLFFFSHYARQRSGVSYSCWAGWVRVGGEGGWGRVVTGWANNRRERPFSLLFFCLCRVVTQRRGRPHVPQTHEKTLFDIIVFKKIEIILKIWPVDLQSNVPPWRANRPQVHSGRTGRSSTLLSSISSASVAWSHYSQLHHYQFLWCIESLNLVAKRWSLEHRVRGKQKFVKVIFCQHVGSPFLSPSGHCFFDPHHWCSRICTITGLGSNDLPCCT